MQNKSPENAPRVEAILTLSDGRKFIVNVAPLATLIEETDYGTSNESIAWRFQQSMDEGIIHQNPHEIDGMGLVADYDFLRLIRDCFRNMDWKEIPAITNEGKEAANAGE